MTTPKKHHYLPQFYLEKFKISPQHGKYSHIYQIDKSASPKANSAAIKDTGCKSDFHTLDFNNQDKDRQSVESFLSKIETEQAKLVDSICKNKNIAEDQKLPLAEFITMMRFRIPTFKRYIDTLLEGAVESSVKILIQQGKIPKPPKELEDQDYDFPISNWKILQLMFQMAFQSENSSLLGKMKYQLFLVPNGLNFITGDSPVALYYHNYDSIKPYGVGLMFKDIEVTFPISKKLLVKLTWDGKEGVSTIHKDEVNEYNRRSIIMADSLIFSSEENSDLLEKVALFSKVEAGYKFENLYFGKGAAHISRFIPVTK